MMTMTSTAAMSARPAEGVTTVNSPATNTIKQIPPLPQNVSTSGNGAMAIRTVRYVTFSIIRVGIN